MRSHHHQAVSSHTILNYLLGLVFDRCIFYLIPLLYFWISLLQQVTLYSRSYILCLMSPHYPKDKVQIPYLGIKEPSLSAPYLSFFSHHSPTPILSYFSFLIGAMLSFISWPLHMVFSLPRILSLD